MAQLNVRTTDDDAGVVVTNAEDEAERPARVAVFVSGRDGAVVVDVSTEDANPAANHRIRVWLNEGLLFNGDPEIDEPIHHHTRELPTAQQLAQAMADRRRGGDERGHPPMPSDVDMATDLLAVLAAATR
jgi:hypothetical protein